MPIDYENMLQYTTPIRSPECGEHTFQTDAKPSSPSALIDAECTGCGHALTKKEIQAQVTTLPSAAIQAMMAKYQGGKSDESLELVRFNAGREPSSEPSPA